MKNVLFVATYLLSLVMYPATKTIYFALNFITSVTMVVSTSINSLNSIVYELSDMMYGVIKSMNSK